MGAGAVGGEEVVEEREIAQSDVGNVPGLFPVFGAVEFGRFRKIGRRRESQAGFEDDVPVGCIEARENILERLLVSETEVRSEEPRTVSRVIPEVGRGSDFELVEAGGQGVRN